MKETLPSYEAMMPVVLKVLADGTSRPLREVFELVCQHYAFTPDQPAETLPSGCQTMVRPLVGLALAPSISKPSVTQIKLSATQKFNPMQRRWICTKPASGSYPSFPALTAKHGCMWT